MEQLCKCPYPLIKFSSRTSVFVTLQIFCYCSFFNLVLRVILVISGFIAVATRYVLYIYQQTVNLYLTFVF